MGRFASDPDFALTWPRDVFADELRRLIAVAERDGQSAEWTQEVELLLEQAFSSTVPRDDFSRLNAATWAFDDEPF